MSIPLTSHINYIDLSNFKAILETLDVLKVTKFANSSEFDWYEFRFHFRKKDYQKGRF